MSLYRSFIRASKGLGDAQTRRETVSWVRRDFENGLPLLADQVRRHSTHGEHAAYSFHALMQEKARTFFASASRQLKQMSSANMLVGTHGDKFRGPMQR